MPHRREPGPPAHRRAAAGGTYEAVRAGVLRRPGHSPHAWSPPLAVVAIVGPERRSRPRSRRQAGPAGRSSRRTLLTKRSIEGRRYSAALCAVTTDLGLPALPDLGGGVNRVSATQRHARDASRGERAGAAADGAARRHESEYDVDAQRAAAVDLRQRAQFGRSTRFLCRSGARNPGGDADRTPGGQRVRSAARQAAGGSADCSTRYHPTTACHGGQHARASPDRPRTRWSSRPKQSGSLIEPGGDLRWTRQTARRCG